MSVLNVGFGEVCKVFCFTKKHELMWAKESKLLEMDEVLTYVFQYVI